MNTFSCLVASSLIITSLGAPFNNEKALEGNKHPNTNCILVLTPKLSQKPHFLNNLFTRADAEKILGEPAHLTDSSFSAKKDTTEYKSAYTANARDQKTGQTGVIYFMIEQYAFVSSAERSYSAIKTANEKHEGIKILQGLGDEAYFHTDGKNFYFILVRKADKMFRMKVNKITSNTSVNWFNAVAKKITAAL